MAVVLQGAAGCCWEGGLCHQGSQGCCQCLALTGGHVLPVAFVHRVLSTVTFLRSSLFWLIFLVQ